MEQELDSLVQQISRKKLSQMSLKPAECGHHIIRRANILTRWDLNNIMWLTIEEHNQVHASPKREDEIMLPRQREYVSKMEHASLKDFLRKKVWTIDEFMEDRKHFLLKELDRKK